MWQKIKINIKYLNHGQACDIEVKQTELSDVAVAPTGEVVEAGNSKLIIPVQGMSCASCVESIEKGLRSLEGVVQASVNFGTEKATVVFDPKKVPAQKVVARIKEVGYTPVVEKITLPIARMSCASCVQKIEKALRDTPGVISAEVNFGTEKATVTYLTTQLSMQDLKKVVHDLGYEVLDLAEGEEPVDYEKVARQKEIRNLRRKLIMGAILSIPIFLGSFAEWFPWVPEVLTKFWVLLLLATPVQFWVGWQFYRGFWAALKHKSADMNTLIAVGTSAAGGFCWRRN